MASMTIFLLLIEINAVHGLVQGDMNDQELFNGTEKRNKGTKGQSSCPSGWSNYGSRCFRFINTARSWAESEQYCLLQGGNLASVHSRKEFNFIQLLVGGKTGGFPETWIGGYDLAQEGLWLWSDGSRFIFSYWNHGQPNNFQGNQNCLRFNYGAQKLWDDVNCTAAHFSVCSQRM
uniref:C-type lectin domain-containing protein n=1 Tax=Esox lucius TaxID=8010 RepID=A0A3P8Z6A6_ESOLU